MTYRVQDCVKEQKSDRAYRALFGGMKAHQEGDYTRAVKLYEDLIMLEDKEGWENPAPRYLQALLAHQVNDHELAADWLRQALRLRPTWLEAHYNYGVVCMHLGQWAEAEEHLRRAIELDPTTVPAWNNLGNVLLGKGEVTEALEAFERAVAAGPVSVEETWNRSNVYLMLGRWAEGWRDYEARWSIPGFTAHNGYPAHLVRLQSLDQLRFGSRVLVTNEQGAGDLIQMLRYHSVLASRGARVTWRVGKNLVQLVERALGADAVDAADDSFQVAAGYVVPCMSLPLVCGTTDETKVPLRDKPYLQAPPFHVFNRQLLHVGLCWQGSKDHRNDGNRSIPFKKFDEFLGRFEDERIEFHVLQPLDDEAKVARLTARGVERRLEPAVDWWHTARQVAAMDLIISVDTALVHLAGAMGKTVFMLTANPPDWRWGIESTRNPWYKSVYCIRQRLAGKWHPVFETVLALVQENLTSFLEGANEQSAG